MSQPLAGLHMFVDGRVQGVGFRHFVMMEAIALELTGWVRNLDDGRVEAYAEGPKDLLDQLLANVRRGPRSAYVSEVSIEWKDASGKFSGFNVRFGYGQD